MSESQFLCIICNSPVTLERAKTNEYGKPLHEMCYAISLHAQFSTSKTPQAWEIPTVEQLGDLAAAALSLRCPKCEAQPGAACDCYMADKALDLMAFDLIHFERIEAAAKTTKKKPH